MITTKDEMLITKEDKFERSHHEVCRILDTINPNSDFTVQRYDGMSIIIIKESESNQGNVLFGDDLFDLVVETRRNGMVIRLPYTEEFQQGIRLVAYRK